MHGIILSELKKYVTEKLGPSAWPKLLSEAGLPNKIYLASTLYPDEEVVVETTIHTAVRMRNPGAAPPQLKITRLSPKHVQIVYGSKRKMCALGKGMLTALGGRYHQPLTVTETSCMMRGAAECRIDVKAA